MVTCKSQGHTHDNIYGENVPPLYLFCSDIRSVAQFACKEIEKLKKETRAKATEMQDNPRTRKVQESIRMARTYLFLLYTEDIWV